MSLKRFNPKRDAAEPAIVQAAERIGAEVVRLSIRDWPDLLVLWRREFRLWEVKTRKRKDQPGQDATLAECRYRNLPAYVVRTPEEALQAIGATH